VNFETGRTTANRPITVLPFNSISDFWMDAGRQGYDWSFYDDPARNPNARTQVAGAGTTLSPLLGRNQLFDQVLSVFSSPTATAPDLMFRTETRVTTGTIANAVRAGTFNSLVNRDTANDAINYLVTRNVGELPGAFWGRRQRAPWPTVWRRPRRPEDTRIHRLQRIRFPKPDDRRNRPTGRLLPCLQHRLRTARVGGPGSASNSPMIPSGWTDAPKNAAFSSNNGNHIRVDVNPVLPNGQVNPNYGRPFTFAYGQSTWTNDLSERETKRATAFLKYDFNDLGTSWGKWLGRHTVTGLYEENALDEVSYRHRLAVDGAAARDISSDINAFARRPGAVIYLGPSIIGNNNPLQLEAIQVPLIQAGPIATPASYFVRAAGTTDPGAFVSSPATLVEINDGGTAQRDVIKSQAFLLQSYWLNDLLVTLVGWRRDEDFFCQRNNWLRCQSHRLKRSGQGPLRFR
jgi:hypothetical protein